MCGSKKIKTLPCIYYPGFHFERTVHSSSGQGTRIHSGAPYARLCPCLSVQPDFSSTLGLLASQPSASRLFGPHLQLHWHCIALTLYARPALFTTNLISIRTSEEGKYPSLA